MLSHKSLWFKGRWASLGFVGPLFLKHSANVTLDPIGRGRQARRLRYIRRGQSRLSAEIRRNPTIEFLTNVTLDSIGRMAFSAVSNDFQSIPITF
jgi:hypothetical protein